ncbi:hypothetical protein H8356DRAFT_1422897 [Neocallimastix lanati (nom. inval.)]|nr:hypothetical protein H8356DRAFT_1422897 [Neocallimastix sp. JGI-2020a]
MRGRKIASPFSPLNVICHTVSPCQALYNCSLYTSNLYSLATVKLSMASEYQLHLLEKNTIRWIKMNPYKFKRELQIRTRNFMCTSTEQ